MDSYPVQHAVEETRDASATFHSIKHGRAAGALTALMNPGLVENVIVWDDNQPMLIHAPAFENARRVGGGLKIPPDVLLCGAGQFGTVSWLVVAD